jgi:hypothetical protein
MPKIFDRLYYVGPLGLGDSFLHNGIVHHFASQCFELHVPAWPQIHKTVACLYQDFPNIKVVPLRHYDEGENQYIAEQKLSRILPNDMIRINSSTGEPMAPLWDVQVYAYYGLSFSLRYNNFHLPKHVEGAEELYQDLSKGEPYILVHKRSSKYPTGFPIDINNFRKNAGLPTLKVVEVQEGITDNMMQYVKLIENAEEIHCVASSFHCLVDSIYNRTKGRLFFHDIRADALMKINSHDNQFSWQIVDYGVKL